MRKLLFLTLLLTACPTTVPPIPIPPDPIFDDENVCVTASKTIDKVCPKLSFTPAGKPFDQFCREKMQQGVPMNPSCIVNASSCEEANRCLGSH